MRLGRPARPPWRLGWAGLSSRPPPPSPPDPALLPKAARECQRFFRSFHAVSRGRLEALERQWHRLLGTGPYGPPPPPAPAPAPAPPPPRARAAPAETSAEAAAAEPPSPAAAPAAPRAPGQSRRQSGAGPSRRASVVTGHRPSVAAGSAAAQLAAAAAAAAAVAAPRQPRRRRPAQPWTWDGGLDPLRAHQMYEAAIRVPWDVRRALLRAYLSFQRRVHARRLMERAEVVEAVRAGEALSAGASLFAVRLEDAAAAGAAPKKKPPSRPQLTRTMSMFHDRKPAPPQKPASVAAALGEASEPASEAEGAASEAEGQRQGGTEPSPKGRRRGGGPQSSRSRRKKKGVTEAEAEAAAARAAAASRQRELARATEAAIAAATYVWQKEADAEAERRRADPGAAVAEALKGPPRLRVFMSRQELMRTVESAVKACAVAREEAMQAAAAQGLAEPSS
eukprot:tig00021434_g21319.t1